MKTECPTNIFENTHDVVLIATQYGESKDHIRVCLQKCKSDPDFLYKRTSTLYENLNDAILQISKDIRNADAVIVEDEITANEIMKIYCLENVYLFFEDIVSMILPSEKLALLKGNKTVADVYSLIFDENNIDGMPELFITVEQCRRCINAMLRYDMLHNRKMKLRKEHSDYIEYVKELIKNDSNNIAVLFYSKKRGSDTLSGIIPNMEDIPGERFWASDCKNNASSKELVKEFLKNVKTIVIFEENEEEFLEYLKNIFGEIPSDFSFNVINLFRFAKEMFESFPDGLAVLNYYLFSFNVLYNTCIWDRFDRLGEYYHLLLCMLTHYDSIEKKL